ncbi:NAD(P)-binding domain protein [Beauveria brongniartii RCEF 3172]|uniref:NAD(P)-binding domain protein n=1 Tax=Beauveria brongniartii RCEF 3172 TaxID=1081107 RepID=A0A162KF11_9HYPO|nr:NAD(P)-binding domain protein [Beauveria brongniartii RCEF 3172]
MRITIVPAGPKTSAATIRRLLQEAPTDVEVYGIYRNLSKVPADFGSHENFHAVYGDVEDASSLDVGGSDAVMTSTPPFFTGEDPFEKAEQVSRNVKDAVERAGGVKRLMLLSSLGAEFEQGVGEIKTNHIAEKILKSTSVPEILLVRCAYFMENWTLFNWQTLKGPEPYFNSVITPLELQLPMVAVEDIGSTFAAELLSAHAPPTKPYVFALHGPREYSPNDVQVAFSEAMERQVAVKAIAKDKMANFFSTLFPPSLVGIWVEMSSSFLPGGIASPGSEGLENLDIVRGQVGLGKAIKDALG